MIKHGASILALSAAFGLCGAVMAGQDLLWEIEQPPATFVGTDYSMVYDSSTGSYNAEVADDFDATGLIQEIAVPGRSCGQCSPMEVEGVFVRVYEWTDSGPGELQHERFVSTGDGFEWGGLNPFSIYITLNEPIPVDGWHFISVQVAFGNTGGVWYFKQSNRFNNINQPIYFRDNLDGGGWAQHEDSQGLSEADFAISIYGEAAATMPAVDSVDPATVTPSDQIVVNGSGFGPPGNGELLINGQPAIITTWAATQIIGYVPESVAAGQAELIVTNLNISSDPFALTIVDREPIGRLLWVFEGAGDYSVKRPAIAPDGTVYVDDIDGNLYALSPDGGLLWIVDALLGQEGGGDEGPIAVGSDGTIYVGTNPLGPTVELVAFEPNGTHRWTFTIPQALTWQAGPSIGPDGRIYGSFNAAQFLGNAYDLFAVNPDGTLAWQSAASPAIYENAAPGSDVIFGPTQAGGSIDQMLFTADQNGDGRNWGFDIADGDQNFATPTGGGNDVGQTQLAGNPGSGDFYMLEFNGIGGAGWGLQAFDPQGNRTWRFDPGIASGASHPSVDSNGDIYFSWDLLRISSVDSSGSENWTVVHNDVSYNDPVPSPVDPALVIHGTRTNNGTPFSFIEGRSTADGSLLWTQDVVDQDGSDVAVYSKPTISPDGKTAYFTALELPITPTSTFRIFAVNTMTDQPEMPGDVDGNGVADVFDLLELLSAWGSCAEPACPADLTGDGAVNVFDLLELLASWG